MNKTVTQAQYSELDRVDRRLIHAVQVAPRASWTALAPIVGADAVTLARRWERLRDAGIVWVTGYAGYALHGASAMLEIECDPGSTLALADELSADPEAFTIDLTAGGRDLLVTFGADHPDRLSSYVLERMQQLPSVRSMRTHLLSSAIVDARVWRLRALDATEVAAVERTVPPATGRGPSRVDPELERGLLDALGEDGRAGVTALAARLDASPRRIREGIATMIDQDRLVLRADMARSRSGWPVYAWYFLRVPAAMVERVGPALSRMDEIRLVATAVGQYNLLMAVWMRTISDVQRLEVLIEEKLPGVVIADRSVVLRTVKHLGRRLDDRGLATGGFVPLAIHSARGDGLGAH